MKLESFCRSIGVVSMLAAAAPSHATGPLAGQSLRGESMPSIVFPGMPGGASPIPPGVAVVGDDVEFIQGERSIDFTTEGGWRIALVVGPNSTSLTTGILRFVDVNGTIPSFADVALLSADGELQGLTRSMIGVTDDAITINLDGLTWGNSSDAPVAVVANMQIAFATAVPEPAASWLLAAGLALTPLLTRRRCAARS